MSELKYRPKGLDLKMVDRRLSELEEFAENRGLNVHSFSINGESKTLAIRFFLDAQQAGIDMKRHRDMVRYMDELSERYDVGVCALAATVPTEDKPDYMFGIDAENAEVGQKFLSALQERFPPAKSTTIKDKESPRSMYS